MWSTWPDFQVAWTIDIRHFAWLKFEYFYSLPLTKSYLFSLEWCRYRNGLFPWLSHALLYSPQHFLHEFSIDMGSTLQPSFCCETHQLFISVTASFSSKVPTFFYFYRLWLSGEIAWFSFSSTTFLFLFLIWLVQWVHQRWVSFYWFVCSWFRWSCLLMCPIFPFSQMLDSL